MGNIIAPVCNWIYSNVLRLQEIVDIQNNPSVLRLPNENVQNNPIVRRIRIRVRKLDHHHNPGVPVPGYQLLHLPTLVLDNIVGFLDCKSLKSLRHVCQLTDSLVYNNASFYEKTYVYIGDKDRLKEVISSNRPWRNFILCEQDGRHPELKLLFLDHFRPTMRRLEVRGMLYSAAGILSYTGPELESLHLNMQNMATVRYGTVGDELPQIPKEWFLCLSHLNLEIDSMTNGFIANMRELCVVFMENCPNLASVKFPIAFRGEFEREIYCQKEAVDEFGKPLIEFLKRKVAMAKGKSSSTTNVVIDWCSIRGRFTDEGPLSPFPLTTSVLLQIAKLCESIGGQLCNVQSSALPSLESVSIEEKEILDRCITSVHSFNWQLGNLKNLYIPRNAKLELVVESYMFEDTFDEAQLNLHHKDCSLNISSISVNFEHFDTETLLGYLKTVYRELLETRRESVTKLDVKIRLNTPFHWIQNLKYLFPNLKELSIETVHRGSNEPKLMQLPNHDLNHLRDLTLIGVYLDFSTIPSPFLASMRRLDHLRLIDVGVKGLDGVTFLNCCPKKPKTFVFVPRRGYARHVRFQDIRQVMGAQKFKNTIETLVCFIPSDLTQDKGIRFLNYLKSQKHLRSDRPWDMKYFRESVWYEVRSDRAQKFKKCFGNLLIPAIIN